MLLGFLISPIKNLKNGPKCKGKAIGVLKKKLIRQALRLAIAQRRMKERRKRAILSKLAYIRYMVDKQEHGIEMYVKALENGCLSVSLL